MGQYKSAAGRNSTISNYENNRFELPEDGSPVMDIRLLSVLKLSISQTDLQEALGEPEGEEAANPASYLADKQEQISEALAASLKSKLAPLQEAGNRCLAWANQPGEPLQEGEEWKLEVKLRAHLQGKAIKQSLAGRLGGKLSENAADQSRAAQEAQVQEKARQVKAAFEAAIGENQDLYAPLTFNGASEESEIQYAAELSLNKNMDAHLGSETQSLSL